MTVLQAVQILNLLLSLGMNAVPAAQRIAKVIEKSVKAGNAKIDDADWEWAISSADAADANLQAAINAHKNG